jgi:Na+/proline symporter
MIDLAIVLAFIAYSVSSGFRARAKASESPEEYFLAGRTLPGWKAGVSMAATQYAADTPLLAAGLIATGGLFMLWRLWIYGIAFLIMGFLLGRAWRRAGVLTDAELTEIRYSGQGVAALRGLKAVYYGTVINCTVLAMVLVAATRISETFLPWHQWLPPGLYGPFRELVARVGVPLASGAVDLDPWVATTDNLISIFCILGFTALYSTTGGLRSVVATDVVQFLLAMVATLTYAVVAVRAAGGLGGMLDTLVERYGQERASELLSLTPTGGDLLLPFLTLIGLQWFFQVSSDGTGYLAQRTMACRTDRDAEHAGFIFTWAQVFFRSLLWLPIGVALLVIYPYAPGEAASDGFTAGREILFATGIQDLLPPGIRGLMLTGLLAALASTVDTHLNWGASYWSNDLYKGLLNQRLLRREPGSRELVVVARLSNLVILVIGVAIMANLGSIQAAWHVSLLFGAGMGSVLVLRWLWERINLWSEVAAMAASLVVAPVLLWTVEAEWLKLLLMAGVSTGVMLVVTWLTPATEAKRLDAFYERVHPPGLWRRAAERTGDDPARPGRLFLRGAYLVATTGITVYLLLIGVTKLLLPPPGEPAAVAWAYVLAATVTVGLWWRRFRRPSGHGVPSRNGRPSS